MIPCNVANPFGPCGRAPCWVLVLGGSCAHTVCALLGFWSHVPLAAWLGWGGLQGTHDLSLEGQLGLFDLSPEAAVRVTPVVTAGQRASGFWSGCRGFVCFGWAPDPTYDAHQCYTYYEGV